MASKPSSEVADKVSKGSPSKHSLTNKDNNDTAHQIQKIAKKIAQYKDKSKSLDNDALEKQIVELWKPQFPTVALFVRWASRAKRDFNRDSISLVHTIAEQSGLSAMVFLEQVKSYRFTRGLVGPYGFKFSFASAKSRGKVTEKTYNKKIDSVVHGLKLTIQYLELEFANNGCAMGKAGMKSRAQKMEVKKVGGTSVTIKRKFSDVVQFDLGGNIKYAGEALVKTHLSHTFESRLWLEVEHRFLAFHVVKFLIVNAQPNYFQDEEFLEFSYRLLAPCRSRYDFLVVLSNLCLIFPDKKAVEVRKQAIAEFWECRHDDNTAQNFHGYSHEIPFTETQKTDAIHLLFEQFRLRKSMNFSPHVKRKNSAQVDALWWDCIRANCFRHYLEMGKCTSMKAKLTLKKDVPDNQEPDPSSVKRIRNNPDITMNAAARQLPSSFLPKPPIIQGSLSLDACLDKTRVALACKYIVPNCQEKNCEPHTNTGSIVPVTAPNPLSGSLSTQANSIRDLEVQPLSALMSLVAVDSSRLQSLRIATQQEIDNSVYSELVVKTPFGKYCLSLAPLEVYSASSLRSYHHERKVMRPPVPAPDANHVNIYIGNGVTEFIDRQGDILHVARPNSAIFHENKHLFEINFSSLAEFLVLNGSNDSTRSPGSYRVNIGCGGLDWSPDGSPSQLVGLSNFGRNCKCEVEKHSLLLQIGKLSSFVWGCMQSFQRHAQKPQLATNKQRKTYAGSLKKALFIPEKEMEAESITLALMCIFPETPTNHDHLDTMNCHLYSSSKTGCMDVTLVDSSGKMYLLQVLLNFRKVITHHKLPYHLAVKSISAHVKSYLTIVQESYHQSFLGQEMLSAMPTPFDKTGFFIDDSLPFDSVNIGGSGRSPINVDILLIPIGVSRTFSLSAANDIMMRLSELLKTDQLIEMSLVVSLMNTPVRFNYIMNQLIKQTEQGWNFQAHPIYDWLEATIELFGCWQGGPHQRWSPSHIPDIGKLFGGAQADGSDASVSKKKEGAVKLAKIASILFDFVMWIDSLIGLDKAEDLPIAVIKSGMSDTIKAVNQVVDIGFGSFRLAVFLNVINACRLTKSGCHLRQLFFPVQNTASYNHLRDPAGDMMSYKQAKALVQDETMTVTDIQNFENDGTGHGVDEVHFDGAMRAILEEVGVVEYYRDVSECILCESMHSRRLEKKEWLLRNCRLTDIDRDGRIITKRPGKQSRWEVFQPKDRKHSFAFLKPNSSAGVGEYVQNNTTLMCIANMQSTAGKVEYVHHDSTLMCIANTLGQELRNSKKVVFNGRETKTSNSVEHYSNSYATEVQLMPHQHSCANFFCGTHAKLTNLKNMNVLSSGEYPKDLHHCNDFRHYVGGRALFNHLHGVLRSPLSLEMLGACYHRGGDESNDQITYYQGHFDKAFVCSGWLIPLGESFFTFVSIPTAWHYQQDQRSLASYNQWISTIKNEKERKKLVVFATAFKEDAKKAMNNVDCKIYIFENKIGSLLAFPSNICYHTTVTPPSKVPRDLLIIHPLIGDKLF